jgi:hypothetical protein
MSKLHPSDSKINEYTAIISKLETGISKQFGITEQEFAEQRKINEGYTKFFSKKSNPKDDALLDEELDKLSKEMGIKQEFKKPLTDVEKQLQELEAEMEREDTQLAKQPKLSDSLKFSQSLLESHVDLADELANRSTNSNEKEELTQFTENAKAFSATLSDISGKDNESKLDQMDDKSKVSLLSNVAFGIEKLYSLLKSGASKAIDTIKELGSKFASAVKSLFSKSPEEQNLAFSNVATDTTKTIDNIKEPSEKLKAAVQDLRESYKNLQEQYGKIIPKEKQQTFKKFQAVHNAEKMTHPELIKETKKLAGAMAKQLTKNNMSSIEQTHAESIQRRSSVKKDVPGIG